MRVVGCVLHARGHFCTPLQTHSIIHDPACIRAQFSLAFLSLRQPPDERVEIATMQASSSQPAPAAARKPRCAGRKITAHTHSLSGEHTQDMIPWGIRMNASLVV